MGNETFGSYPPFYGYIEPYYVMHSIRTFNSLPPISVVSLGPKIYGPYGAYTFGPY